MYNQTACSARLGLQSHDLFNEEQMNIRGFTTATGESCSCMEGMSKRGDYITSIGRSLLKRLSTYILLILCPSFCTPSITTTSDTFYVSVVPASTSAAAMLVCTSVSTLFPGRGDNWTPILAVDLDDTTDHLLDLGWLCDLGEIGERGDGGEELRRDDLTW